MTTPAEALHSLLPDATTVLIIAPPALLYALVAAAFVGRLRSRNGLEVAYTRKTFHFLIITVAAVVHLLAGTPGVVVYGAVAAAVVLVAVARGDGFPFYEALARPKDLPHRTLYILVPLVTTAAGGVLAALLFPQWAHVGYLAVAWGDAVGEPVGARWGRHRYRVPSLAGVPATRSIEGSAAVLLTTLLAAFGGLIAGGVHGWPALGAAAVIGAACAAVEAVSHHGLDNLTLQLTAAAGAALLIG